MTISSSQEITEINIRNQKDYILFQWNESSISFYLPDCGDHIQQQIRTKSCFYEQKMLEDIALRVSPGDEAIDVGANIGNHTVFLAKCCDVKVYALEPMPHTFSILKHNIEINEITDRVTPLQIAAGQSTGQAELETPNANNLGMTQVHKSTCGPIDIRPIDSLAINGRLTLLKVDVEGMELDVLKGAHETIRRDRPWIYVETQNPVNRYQIGTYLASLGYYGDEIFNYTPTVLFAPAFTKKERFSATLRSIEKQRVIAESAKHESHSLSDKWTAFEEKLSGSLNDLQDRIEQPHLNAVIETSVAENKAQYDALSSVFSENAALQNAQREELLGRMHELNAVYEALSSVFSENATLQNAQREELLGRMHELNAVYEALSSIFSGHAAQQSAQHEEQLGRMHVFEKHLAETTETHAGNFRSMESAVGELSARLMTLQELVTQVAAPLARVVSDRTDEVERLKRRNSHLESRLRSALRRQTDGRAKATGDDLPLSPVGRAAIAGPQEEANGRSIDDHLIFDDDLSSSWNNWRPNQDVTLQDVGGVLVNQNASTPGVRRDEIPVQPKVLYEVRLDGEFPPATSRPFMWVRDVAHDRPLAQRVLAATGVLRFTTTATTRAVDLGVFVEDPKPGYTFNLRRVMLSSLGQVTGQSQTARKDDVVASLASIPSRREALKDVVNSLLPQVSRLRVYLNGYEDVPQFLLHPRIDVRRSQDHDDLGDAGKFAWVEEDDEGYRLICDDDLLYPPDYVETMLEKLSAYDDRIVLGLHGVLLKQPINNYYDSSSRHVFHFSGSLSRDQSVHVLGTGTVVYHTSALQLSCHDFGYRNMADIWLAARAQDQKTSLVAAERPANWVIQNLKAKTRESIWDHSTKEQASSLNSALVQTAVVRQRTPLTIIPAALQQDTRKKVVFAVKTYNRQDYLHRCIETWLETRNPNYDWAVIIADDGSTDGTLDYLDNLVLPHETHIIRNNRRYAVGQTNTIFELCSRIGFDVGFNVDDDVVFMKPGWEDLYLNAIEETGYQHLCFLHKLYWESLEARRNPCFNKVPAVIDRSGLLETLTGIDGCMGALFTFTPEVLERVGPADEANFPIRGQWHIDYSARCARAGFNAIDLFWDARGSNDCIELQNTIDDDYRCALAWEEYKPTKQEEELNRRLATIHDPNRVRLPWPESRLIPGQPPKTTLNEFFERTVVLNLDRRADRWETIAARCDALGIAIERHAACDGQDKPNLEAWRDYASTPLLSPPQSVRPVTTSREFYLDYDSETARIAFLEARHQRRAISSPGAWGYLKSMIAVLEQALRDDIETLLVLDDDAIFHRDFHSLFADGVHQLPENWKILQLGALQYHWGEDWIRNHSKNLYLCDGTSIGSHAVGMHASIVPMLLEHACRMILPYDIGALHAVKSSYPNKCFTMLPNLVIQDTSESDINSSEVQSSEGIKEQNIYRWKLGDYIHLSI